MRKLATLDQPAFITVTEKQVMTVTALPRGQVLANEESHYRTAFDSANRRECVFLEPGLREVVIGPSFFAPDTWLVARSVRRLSQPSPQPSPEPSAANMLPDLSDLKVIADVVAVEKPAYDIVLDGTVPNKTGGVIYHLTLRPHSDPLIHNLRELWIDSSTNQILRAIIQGRYKPMPREALEETYALEDFGQVGPYWLVIHRIWTWDPPASGTRLRFEATVQTMQFPASLPAWLFDERAFPQHAQEVESVLAVPASPPP